MSTTSQPTGFEDVFRQVMLPWARRTRLSAKLALALAFLAAASGIATYIAWTGVAPSTPDPRIVLILLVIDMVLLLSLGVLVARQLVRLWVERRSGSAGSRLHTRFVALFSLLAVTPAIIVAVFSAAFFYLGIEAWFSERVRTAVQESLAVAEAYVDEHRNTIRADILAMARDVNRAAPHLMHNADAFGQFLNAQAAVRALSEATVFDSSGRILARTTLSLWTEFEDVPLGAINLTASGDVVIIGRKQEDRVRALVRLDLPLDTFLYVGRFVDPVVLNHVEKTRDVVSEYEALEGSRSDIQLTSALLFIVVAMLLLLVAVWLGLVFANRLVQPIRALVETAERVRLGDLTTRVSEGDSADEIGTLSRAFNRMTSQLETQRSELVEANRQMDQRRRFTEAVLAGVSAGVLGLDGDGCINLPNRSALELLDADYDQLVGRRLADVLPEMAPLLAQARARPQRVIEGDVSVVRGGRRSVFRVRVGADRSARGGTSFVVTFDNITELMTAQRRAAWADVARRIAHEIKNPLTPIQLSAERLKRKYSGEVVSDPDVFSQCTDTIIRQVGDIGRMVDEFSAFARMPAAEMRPELLDELVREAVFPQRFAHGDIEFGIELPADPVPVRCDARQIGQVLTNLLQNAVDAIEARQVAEGDGGAPGQVDVSLVRNGSELTLEVCDNGKGLPVEDRERLTEPYVTTRDKGTGLGLAIVKKIVEEHGWRMELTDGDDGGACVKLLLPVLRAKAGSAPGVVSSAGDGDEVKLHGA